MATIVHAAAPAAPVRLAPRAAMILFPLAQAGSAASAACGGR
ncbi:hypothetical protein [Aureimonas leprariae]|nr:hypothetical protein [Aureimonas leprariae]